MESLSRAEWPDEGPSRRAVAHRSAELESALYRLHNEIRGAINAADNQHRPSNNAEERLEPVEEESEWTGATLDPPPDIDALNATASEFEIPWVWNEGMPPQLSAIFTASLDAGYSPDSDMESINFTETNSTNLELAQDMSFNGAGSSADRTVIETESTRASLGKDLTSENSGLSLDRAHKESDEWKFVQLAFKLTAKIKNWKSDPLPDIQEDSNLSRDRTGGEESEHMKRDNTVEFDTRSFALRSRVSLNSSSTYYTAPSGIGNKEKVQLNRFHIGEEHSRLLISKRLLPVASLLEKDWSGRGQHTEFQKHEKKLVDSILDAQEVLGSTRTAIVQSVRCKRILLARKTVRCNRNFSKEKAIEEAAHLNKLDHSHVVQVIGTYIMGNELSILMYPVAEYNLESFTNDLDPRSHTEAEWINRLLSLRSFIGCLVVAVEYLHSHMTKHMDIKPQNILVRNVSRSTVPCVGAFKIYIADFGISRSYENLDAIETEGPTMFTPKYAAPEVVDKQKRGLSADIFSLGCVIVEIVTTLDYYFRDTKIVSPETRYTATIRKSTDGQHPLHDLYEILKSHEYGDTSYQANVDAVCDFLGEKSMSDLPKMLSRNPQDRPSATSLASDFKHRRKCCMSAADPLEAAARDTTEQETNEPFTP